MNPKIHYILFIALGLIYAFFPTQNAMIDSWYYASCVKYQQELINNHHLIYNIIGTYWFYLLRLFNPNIEAISALNLMNAFGATSCLLILYSCLLKLKNERNIAFLLSFFCGVSFGFMRYATDAETYILPLLFSLIATYCFINYRNKKQLFLAGLFAAIAILVHQVQIWWALAMFIFILYQKPFSIQKLLVFSSSFLLLPSVYYISYSCLYNPVFTFAQFIMGEYGKGNATLDISMRSSLLTIASFIRTFIQVHGNIPFLFSGYLAVSISLIIVCVSILIIAFLKNGFNWNISGKTNQIGYSGLFLLAFLFHLIFAYLSSGNAEFMVMLPFLIVLFIASKYTIHKTGLIKTMIVLMGLWNLSVAIIPNALLNINKVDRQVKTTILNPDAYFLWVNKPLVENIMTYHKGFKSKANFIANKTIDKMKLDSLLDNNIPIYTDYSNSGAGWSRERLLSGKETIELLGRYHLNPIDSFQNLYGKNYIYLVQKRED